MGHFFPLLPVVMSNHVHFKRVVVFTPEKGAEAAVNVRSVIFNVLTLKRPWQILFALLALIRVRVITFAV